MFPVSYYKYCLSAFLMDVSLCHWVKTLQDNFLDVSLSQRNTPLSHVGQLKRDIILVFNKVFYLLFSLNVYVLLFVLFMDTYQIQSTKSSYRGIYVKAILTTQSCLEIFKILH